MNCLRRQRQFMFNNGTESIHLNNSEIYFKIYDQNKRIYLCKLLIEDCIRILVQREGQEALPQECDNDHNDDFQIEKHIKFAVIKNIRKGCKVLKLFYKPLKITFYGENNPILELEIFNQSNGIIYMHTTFFFIRNLYGLAERASQSRLINKKTYRLYNTDEFLLALKTDKPLYGSVPFLMGSSKDSGVGLLWENMSDTRVKLTTRVGLITGGKTAVKWWSETGDSAMICFFGKHVLDVRKSFMGATGYTPLPPLFSLGYHQCRWNYDDQEDVLQVDKATDKAGIPYDTIWLDIEHTDGKRYMTWDRTKFNPLEILDYLREKNRHLVVIIDPHLKVDDEYLIYKEAKDNDYLIKDEDGSVFVGKCWAEESSWVDFINDSACAWWSEKIANYLKSLNCTAKYNNLWVWNDMNEPSVFESKDNQLKPTAKHTGNVEHRDVHNIYGQKMAKATWNGILSATGKNLRPFLLSRSFYTGSQKYGAIWTGDSAANWEHLQISVAMMISLSICGIDFCGSDVGGFFGNPDMELLTRWYQLGTLQPFFRAHSHMESNRREPYLIEDPYGAVIKKAISFRYRLLAYWYLCFWLAESKLEPVISPTWMHYPDNYRVIDDDETFMIGTEILARPIVTSGCTFISIVLPGRDTIWYQYCEVSSAWQTYMGIDSVKIPISLTSLPVFYRGGSCIFMKNEVCSNTVDWQSNPYNVYVFPLRNGKSSGILYVDDYSTFSYRNEKHYLLFRITFDPVERSLVCEKEHDNSQNTSFHSKIGSITIIKNRMMSWSGYKNVSVDGKYLDNCEVIHFDDRIEISQLNMVISSNNVLLFEG